jgi:hypothetical protein
LANAFKKEEDYLFKYYQDTGDPFKDFRQAIVTEQKRQAEDLRKALEPLLKTQQTFSAFNTSYGSVIQQTLAGSSFLHESLKSIEALTAHTRDIQRLGESLTPIVEQYQSMARLLTESLRPQIELWQRWTEQHAAIFKDFSQYWIKFNDQYDVAETKAVAVLKKYKWFITPSFPMSFVSEVVKLDQRKGRQDKAVNELFISFFEANNWRNLEHLVRGWKNDVLLKKRYKILMDCVGFSKSSQKSKINKANIILPTLITQIDGVLTDYLNSKGIQWGVDYDDLIDKKTGKVRRIRRKTQFKKSKAQALTTQLDDLANDIFLNILFQRSQRGKPLATPFTFNRHKIIHGESVKYGRTDYVVRAFMVLDLLSYC